MFDPTPGCLENAVDEDYNFSVPLIVDANSAKNWNDAH